MKATAAARTPSVEFHVLLASGRPAVHAFFAGLERWLAGLAIHPFGWDDRYEAPEAAVAVVDVALDAGEGAQLCHDLHARRPSLPLVALVCCPQSIDPWHLEELLGAGVTSLLDLQASAEETARTLASVARGASVLHLHLRPIHRSVLRDLLIGQHPRAETKMRLLQLLARGLPDHEIGRRLHLSPHTVKHRVENLRHELGVRNRIELAAWAGRNGFYRPEREPDIEPAVPVRLARSAAP